jgi:hypothetical protein
MPRKTKSRVRKITRKKSTKKRVVRKTLKRPQKIVREVKSRFLTHIERERLEKLGFHHHVALGERMTEEKIKRLIALVKSADRVAKHAWKDLSFFDERAIKIQLDQLREMK